MLPALQVYRRGLAPATVTPLLLLALWDWPATHPDALKRLRPLPCSVFSGCCTLERASAANEAARWQGPAAQLGVWHVAVSSVTGSFECAAHPHSTRERSEPPDLGL